MTTGYATLSSPWTPPYASSWHKSRNIRAYADAVKHVVILHHGEIKPGSKLERWLTWAHEQADRNDPTVKGLKSILEANLKINIVKEDS